MMFWMQDGIVKQVPFRFKLSKGRQTHVFQPHLLPEDRAGATDFKHSEVGALFAKSLNSVPLTYGKIVWEVEVDKMPPATLRPIKPKYWLLKKVAMEPGQVLRL